MNGFPSKVRNALIEKSTKPKVITSGNENDTNNEEITIWLNFPYTGPKGEQIVKTCVKKIDRRLSRNTRVKFKMSHETTLLSCFTSNKNRTPSMNKSVVYKVKCPGCGLRNMHGQAPQAP